MNRHKTICGNNKGNSGQLAKGVKMKVQTKEELPAKILKPSEKSPNGDEKSKKSPYAEPGKGYPCTDCGKEFRKKSSMLSHHVDVHQPGEFPCPGDAKLCGKVFTSRNKMNCHWSRNCNPNNPKALPIIEKRRASLGLAA